MTRPLFSIVTVTLDCADDAVQTARNVLAQSFPSFEYIVKDGQSVDETPQRLRRAGVVHLISRADTGIYNAMNQALAYCSGEYVCFMNAGDMFPSPGTLGMVAQWIQRSGYPTFLYGDVQSHARHPLLQADQTIRGVARETKYRNRLGRFYLYRRVICHQTWFVRHCFYIKHGGFDERYLISADYAFLLNMVLNESVSYSHISKVTAIYKGGGNSARATELLATEREDIQSAVFSCWERVLYQAVLSGMRLVNRWLVYRHVYPKLPNVLKSRLDGW